ncbi:BppU family phage baseplate upper protein [uncultured Clostridium sp.]|jgi:hypothetical protein|uniref:BppU family phage baseplate upper protein n=1 Tax=uncultured Clostridium sp. TaxID=59620 RepID=UPI00205EDA5E|nr:BppU family phage baseplate upper protein [uncultured Clostridium sp.]DAP98268.1 MAG TPA: Baseplate component [Caudoviricetes sp.]
MDFKSLAKEIIIDVEQFHVPDIDAKQHDLKSRFLKIKLFNEAKEFNVNDRDLAFKFFARKPDGTEVFNNCTVENNFVVIELTSQTLAVAGKVKAELMIYGKANGEVLTTKPFIINVIESINSQSAIESTNEYSVIMNIVKELEEYWRIHRYYSIYDVKSDIVNVPINIAELTREDSVNVYLNGVRLIENVEFRIDFTAAPTCVNLRGNWTNGDQLYFEFLRRVKGKTTGTDGGNVASISANKVIIQPAVFNKSNVQEALTYIKTDVIGGDNLNNLQTQSKTNLINAINELVQRISTLENGTPGKRLNKNSHIYSLTQQAVSLIVPASLNYNRNTDLLEVYIAGAKVSEGANGGYVYNADTNTINCNKGMWDIGTEILIEVIKNI